MIEKTGVFVYVDITDTGGADVASLFYGEYADTQAVREMIAQTHDRVPTVMGEGEYWEWSKWIRGIPYVVVAVPMSNSRGEIVARLEGVYAVAPEIVSDVRRRVIRTALIVVGIVLVTTVLLYPMIVTLMRRLTRMTYNLLDANLETLRVLGSAVAKRDSDTDAHNFRVTIMSVRLGESVGLDRQEMRGLIKGAFLHDVGKIGIRDAVLLKPGPLSDEEFRVMKGHVTHGLDIVSRSEWLNDATEVVGYHHEKYDGTGYRSGLKGSDIPIGARIFAIADVFDALTSKRPYKEPFSLEEALDVLEKGRGSHFDPDLLDAFKALARGLHEELANREDDGLRKELDEILTVYFGRDVEVLI
ncbi:MAG: HD domain-containing protein [Candidatus Latescibacterota bacterium]|nr:MAG: HD domain-containing protein [Candidatus Latescibacterota bacterium]